MGRIRATGRRLGGWFARADSIISIAAGLVAAAGWLFLTVADAATEVGDTDARLLVILRKPADRSTPVGPHWAADAARDVTALGGPAVLTLVVGSVVGFLFISRHRAAALLVLAATTGGAALSTALKDFYDRPRPALVPHLVPVSSPSFPSGHALLSAVVYLTLGALLARHVQGRRAKVYCVGVAVVLTLVVGASRVYLGVHYPTDVVGGWAAGGAWAVTCGLLARHLQRRGLVARAVPMTTGQNRSAPRL